jgi:hypothetical protein
MNLLVLLMRCGCPMLSLLPPMFCFRIPVLMIQSAGVADVLRTPMLSLRCFRCFASDSDVDESAGVAAVADALQMLNPMLRFRFWF